MFLGGDFYFLAAFEGTIIICPLLGEVCGFSDIVIPSLGYITVLCSSAVIG